MSKRVFVGMSGGVDSSVAALLLKQAGYSVTGVYMKNWSQDIGGYSCPWREDMRDAKRVAVQLGIDFQVFDFEKDYKQLVVDYMVEAYKAGLTPNPDITCNQEIKFKLFLKAARDKGADLIATGHYARLQNGKLLAARDKNKDQSYFLYQVSADAFKKTLFPLGELSKAEVRSIARQAGLITAHKKESMGICFVGKVSVKQFLSQYVDVKEGDIVDQHGRIIGRHEGAIFYTIGQRHGLDVGGGLPFYVVDKDIAKNTVTVTTELDDQRLWRENVHLASCHWINPPPALQKTYQARVRHLGELIDANVTKLSSRTALLELQQPVRALAAGQSVVLYRNDVVLGGGIATQ